MKQTQSGLFVVEEKKGEPRRITQLVVNGEDVFALATDGTAWRWLERANQWGQLPPLPE